MRYFFIKTIAYCQILVYLCTEFQKKMKKTGLVISLGLLLWYLLQSRNSDDKKETSLLINSDDWSNALNTNDSPDGLRISPRLLIKDIKGDSCKGLLKLDFHNGTGKNIWLHSLEATQFAFGKQFLVRKGEPNHKGGIMLGSGDKTISFDTYMTCDGLTSEEIDEIKSSINTTRLTAVDWATANVSFVWSTDPDWFKTHANNDTPPRATMLGLKCKVINK